MITASDESQRIQKFLSETKGNTLDALYILYDEYLKTAENPGQALRAVLEFPEEIGNDDGASEKVSIDLAAETKQKYAQHIKTTVSVLAEANNPVDVFYRNLWEMVFTAPTAPQDSAQAAVLLMILCEDIAEIPYYPTVDMVSMENEEFRNRVEALMPLIREAFQMMNRRFSQRTEYASQIYRLLQDLSREDACVLLSIVFNTVENRAARKAKAEASADK